MSGDVLESEEEANTDEWLASVIEALAGELATARKNLRSGAEPIDLGADVEFELEFEAVPDRSRLKMNTFRATRGAPAPKSAKVRFNGRLTLPEPPAPPQEDVDE